MSIALYRQIRAMLDHPARRVLLDDYEAVSAPDELWPAWLDPEPDPANREAGVVRDGDRLPLPGWAMVVCALTAVEMVRPVYEYGTASLGDPSTAVADLLACTEGFLAGAQSAETLRCVGESLAATSERLSGGPLPLPYVVNEHYDDERAAAERNEQERARSREPARWLHAIVPPILYDAARSAASSASCLATLAIKLDLTSPVGTTLPSGPNISNRPMMAFSGALLNAHGAHLAAEARSWPFGVRYFVDRTDFLRAWWLRCRRRLAIARIDKALLD